MLSTRRVILAVAVLAAATAAFAFWLKPPDLSEQFLVAFGTLLLIAVVSEVLALRVTEGGARTSMDFVPHLGAIILLGPAGATGLTAISLTVFQLFLLKNPPHKSLYNVSQVVLSTSLASLTYIALGAEPSLSAIQFTGTALPFFGATLVYFFLNGALVALIISVSQERQFSAIWSELIGTFLFFDTAMGLPLGYLVAYLFTRWGALALLVSLIPIIGLRYSYGLNIELRNLNRDLLQVLVKTLEAQDPYTSGHSLRVAEAAKTIAHELGLSPKQAQLVETAALLHDIGKIDSAYHSILRQEEPLSAEQKKLIRAHPERGVEIVESVRSLDNRVLEYIRHHHERYDGTGYPNGIAGDDIPLGARIIMVADTIDAMQTSRPYRDALSSEVVRKELRRYSGAQFDPTVVQAAVDADVI